MPLTPPKLDDRDFEALFREARNRIPQYLPEWTDWNESDPGITLLQLQSWLAETILYRLNQVPELHYVKMLELLGEELLAAQPAVAHLTFEAKPDAGSEVVVPPRTRVAVDDPDLDAPLYFETETSLVALTATLDKVIRLEDARLSAQTYRSQPELMQDVSEQNGEDARAWAPFGEAAAEIGRQAMPALLLGFKSKQPFTRQDFALHVVPPDARRLLDEPQGRTSPPAPDGEAFRLEADVDWGFFDGKRWRRAVVLDDSSRGLSRTGYVRLRVTGPLPQLPLSQLGYVEASDDEESYYWLRARLSGGHYPTAPELDRIVTNTVRATASVTVYDESLGASDGTPNQVFALANRPVLGAIELEVPELDGEPWMEVDDFYASSPHDRHYVVNRTRGEILFGDGRRGRIPPATADAVIAREYRYGGGAVGNVGAQTITTLFDHPRGISGVTNHRPSDGGRDEETLDEAKMRVAHTMRNGDRAVTLSDFEQLALQAGSLARAHAFAALTPGPDGQTAGRRIEVVIVPMGDGDHPEPSPTLLEEVTRYLDGRRLVTTELCVRGPTYVPVDLAVEVRAQPTADLAAIREEVDRRLRAYLHPLDGGRDAGGWPFGRDVYYSELLREVMLVDGVGHVADLVLTRLVEAYDEAPTQAQMDAARDGLPSLSKPGCAPQIDVLDTTELDDQGEPTLRYYVTASWRCCDLPVEAGALIDVRQIEVAVRYVYEEGR
ncbi:putative baseplate assembly protein [Persicimonas caeni]|uniref:Putative baseplate assembly protein n=1 Tax=Persicimonas caeni TaxID=2292766 RepID=A0A4Y6PV84_PERCE|nr:putative baseplate assembly protein [Persicimonas caeni]QDG52264.1 putative baseplate assembly protein [Persicimonas caeni]QED33486.1 putative baseplate assembly protein [Persicimonas caeni]